MTKTEKAQIQADSIRRSVQAKELIDMLHGIAFDGEQQTQQRIRAADILLKKAVPDLSAVTLDTGPDGIVVQWKS